MGKCGGTDGINDGEVGDDFREEIVGEDSDLVLTIISRGVPLAGVGGDESRAEFVGKGKEGEHGD